ncbi:hypothetical protein L1049_000030 [Liquidambar formosana]|uniref:Uncharacterized protein n=1 Tax=Liquidambar formosana TaxID=63359 RepID=A0AAP0N5X4_LIQFO
MQEIDMLEWANPEKKPMGKEKVVEKEVPKKLKCVLAIEDCEEVPVPAFQTVSEPLQNWYTEGSPVLVLRKEESKPIEDM